MSFSVQKFNKKNHSEHIADNYYTFKRGDLHSV